MALTSGASFGLACEPGASPTAVFSAPTLILSPVPFLGFQPSLMLLFQFSYPQRKGWPTPGPFSNCSYLSVKRLGIIQCVNLTPVGPGGFKVNLGI